jgi:hypothetical protein
MNVEKAIAEIEWLERLNLLEDTRPIQLSDRWAANQRHDEMYANNPWFPLQASVRRPSSRAAEAQERKQRQKAKGNSQ